MYLLGTYYMHSYSLLNKYKNHKKVCTNLKIKCKIKML